MSAVYVSNLVINAGSTFSQTFELGNTQDNSPFNLTGYTIAAQMRKHASSSGVTTFTASISDATSGKILVGLPSTETVNIKPGRYVYDVVVTSGEVKTRVVEGSALVRDGVSR